MPLDQNLERLDGLRGKKKDHFRTQMQRHNTTSFDARDLLPRHWQLPVVFSTNNVTTTSDNPCFAHLHYQGGHKAYCHLEILSL